MVASMFITEISSPLLHLREMLKEFGVRDTDLNLLVDVLFAVTAYARRLKVDAESALEGTTDKFARRFRAVEAAAKAQGRDLKSMTIGEMEALWREAKADEG